ncbi:MAG: UPF0489 family protein [Candidatus Altimarinota bacterium]
MYKKPFYITDCVGNNALSFSKRENKKLFVPSLIEISDFSEIELGDEVVFEDFDFDDNLISAKGLKNFYKITWQGKDIYFFDNHNHALYFWYLAKSEGIIGENNILYHVDEHADTRIPETIISYEETQDLQNIFDYTNFSVNVGNYIVPAVENNLIQEVVQIRSESDLLSYDFQKEEILPVILNLDLDFFEPNLDYIDYELKKKVVLDIAKKAKVITVATSPFFIDQELALKVFKDLFRK